MANILDYIDWRGDLPASEINDVDLLIMSRLTYAPFDGIVPGGFTESIALKDAAQAILSREYTPAIKDDCELLAKAAASERFGSLRLSGYVNLFNPAEEEQFSAIAISTPDGRTTAAFRGTDGTLIGWKEDFNMALSEEVPAQRDAVGYLCALALSVSGEIRLTGHSKGGNLAMYAHAFTSPEIRGRIIATRNFDGPGFSDEMSERAAGMDERVLTYVPQSSVVGMLLGHSEKFRVVKSAQVSVYQHNIYNWFILGKELVPAPGTTGSSRYLDATLKNWLLTMPEDIREKMIDGMYQLMAASGATTIKELTDARNAITYIKALRELDPETRGIIIEALKMLKDSAIKSLEWR